MLIYKIGKLIWSVMLKGFLGKECMCAQFSIIIFFITQLILSNEFAFLSICYYKVLLENGGCQVDQLLI